MQIEKAEHAGYCFGVSNAIKTVDKVLDNSIEPVYMLGDLSHNSQEMERLKEKGIIKIDNIDQIKTRGKVVVRTHGVTRDEIEELQSRDLEVIDATCPFVKAIHEKIAKYDREGYQIVIIGDKNHPEISGAAGWSANEPIIINTKEQAQSLNSYDKICTVSQTTFIQKKFDEIVEILKSKSRDILIFNTICSATEKRQKAAVELAERVDGMLVVGGYHSSNTQKLKELCKAHCKNIWSIETVRDLNLDEFQSINLLGLTAGASTPDWLIKEVTDKMEELNVEQTMEAVETAEPEVKEDMEESVQETVDEVAVSSDDVEAQPESVTEEVVEQATEEAPEVEEAVTQESVLETGDQTEEVVSEEAAPVEEVTEETVVVEEPVAEATEETVEESTEETVQEAAETETKEENNEAFDFAAAIDDYTKPIHKNSAVEGTVLEVHDDEVIVNIGQKSDALILKRDFTWKRDEELKDIVKVGDKVTAIVTDMHTRENDGKFKLSKIKYDNQQIQSRLNKAFENREVLYGKVDSVARNGLMVDVGFTEIFMPASQYHLHFVKDLNALVGHDVRGILIDYNPKRRRAILSQKVLLAEERDERIREQQEIKNRRFEELQVDDVVTGKVKTITDFGIFVDLKGIDGFIHRSDLTWNRNNDPRQLVKRGEEITAKVISRSDDEKKIKLSVKALQEKPWDRFVKSYMENDEIEVTITNTLDFGAFAQIIPGVEGLIHISEISYDRVESVESELKKDDVVKVKIIKIDEPQEKISLSIKATLPRPERIQKTQEEAEYEFEEYGNNRGGKGGKRRNRRQNDKGNVYYEENSEYTLGDSFGDLLGTIDFSSLDEEEETE